ncbi:MAG: hypothetical protein ACTSVE_06455 [Candidatus Helarchaeota archaeon]
MNKCKKCGEILVFKEVVRKDGMLKIKAVCKNHHEQKMEEIVERNLIWLGKLARNILTCVECGKRLIPATREHVKERGQNLLIPVTCPSGCKNADRLVDKRIAVAIRRNTQKMKSIMRPQKPLRRAAPFKQPRGFAPRSSEKVRVTFRIPDKCPSCKAPITTENVHWIGPLEAECPYCGSSIKAREEKL